MTSGSMYGWRNGTGKRPEFYRHSSPGRQRRTRFAYRRDLWLWSQVSGKISKGNLPSRLELGQNLRGSHGTRRGDLQGDHGNVHYRNPLPVADAIIHPEDGAMYFVIGGRKVQSGLYRVTYQGKDSTKPYVHKTQTNELTGLRRQLETLHAGSNPKALELAWPHVDHSDRFVRWAALMAIQRLPTKQWATKAQGKRPWKTGEFTHLFGEGFRIDPFHRKPTDPPVDLKTGRSIINSLLQIKWDKLNGEEQLALVRAYQVTMVRFGKPTSNPRKRSSLSWTHDFRTNVSK